MFFRCWNRFDSCWFVFSSVHAAGTVENRMDAVREWNESRHPYWEIGLPCVTMVSECDRESE